MKRQELELSRAYVLYYHMTFIWSQTNVLANPVEDTALVCNLEHKVTGLSLDDFHILLRRVKGETAGLHGTKMLSTS